MSELVKEYENLKEELKQVRKEEGAKQRDPSLSTKEKDILNKMQEVWFSMVPTDRERVGS